jgi:peptidoglycan hydrolase CwlO-like protein
MGKKKLIVIGIGLVILIITAGIAYQNYEYAKLAREQVNTLNAVIQQKDIEISKLTKELKTKQDALSGVRAELDNTKKALNDAQTQINKVTQESAIPVPETVNK